MASLPNFLYMSLQWSASANRSLLGRYGCGQQHAADTTMDNTHDILPLSSPRRETTLRGGPLLIQVQIQQPEHDNTEGLQVNVFLLSRFIRECYYLPQDASTGNLR